MKGIHNFGYYEGREEIQRVQVNNSGDQYLKLKPIKKWKGQECRSLRSNALARVGKFQERHIWIRKKFNMVIKVIEGNTYDGNSKEWVWFSIKNIKFSENPSNNQPGEGCHDN